MTLPSRTETAAMVRSEAFAAGPDAGENRDLRESPAQPAPDRARHRLISASLRRTKAVRPLG
ncbi:hypothetical protein [Nocardiopsis potens]|uniref:hypothetical protein n=1 Tax=Nocardiopsis potens TaxID=1246458 RepID=UPI0012692B3E|nr:hypothetical protein [Nocardiopsis potens]